jgi:hypothetical protein
MRGEVGSGSRLVAENKLEKIIEVLELKDMVSEGKFTFPTAGCAVRRQSMNHGFRPLQLLEKLLSVSYVSSIRRLPFPL